ncbi:hypothetical protein [Aureimonas phyllosphaerae]|uniref:Uncharacterized protein YdeI (BOF family) n=1 Tax=Aureimonas phyllosphaerae TaxID=1166078 RepID=A0A7W6BYG7_9HYPH|nr:hypothetical protein [Aureimonas phyllosphaerae]MBB3937468.1 uncharacterized protein YdeI (BOF family) [Aureimonas phyllosphaerae]MBB3961466.1 uncharacterized protein YdeI (BOF family) [Aureimonas phyllosphaerae]SFF38435.1 Predicted protein YdeI with OB-fold, BOF family [Aureimonas phyllosphaerae]
MKTTLSPKRRFGLAALAVPLLAGSTLAFAQGAPTTGATPPAPPAPRTATVNELRDMNDLRLDGRVAEVFGNRFVLEDATGRTLVELGPRGERGDLVKVGDAVSVDGRFARGQIDARSISVGGAERIALERPRPERDGPRGPGGPGRGPDRDGPRHGPRGEDGPPPPREERAGRGWFGGGVDEAAATKALTDAGYSEVTLTDTKKHHAEFTAKDATGKVWAVKVDEDNRLAEREPYVAPMAEDAARAAIEKLGYTYGGDFEVKKNHVEADAKDAAGRDVRIELNADGSLRKERFES